MEYKISEIVEINKHSMINSHDKFIINYLDTASLTEGKINEVMKLDVTKDRIPSRARRIVKENDILISTVRPNKKHYGFVREKESEYIVSTGFAVLTPNTDVVDPYFLYKYLTLDYVTDTLQTIAEGSTSAYPSIRPSIIGDLKIKLPKLSTQQKIGGFLRNIDEKLGLNYEIINSLEQLAQTLFKRWFVDFEFPNENGDSYKSSGGEMVESELGMIPAGWRLGTVKEILEFSPKESLKKGNLVTYVEMKNLNSSAMIYEWNKREFKGSGSKFRNGDTLLARITPCLENGKIGFVDFLEKEEIGWGSTEFIIVRSRSGIASLFSYFVISESRFKDYAIANLNGSSGRQRVKAETLADFKLAIPSLKIINSFTDTIQPLINNMSNINRQNISLQKLRDTLLSKLLSGEIELPDETEVTEDVPIS